ncbi:DNA polymerase III subunit delta' [Oceanisphaera sp. W20_SRM_FM3]|uniref:DNA polymerase III subunit delta' n=1 Tax=Oceanisphaera sp. W20_SRM_FM3 TaxID=3240267 RepID=UPI003F97F0B1
MYPWLSESLGQLLPLIARRQLGHALLIKGTAGLGKLHLSQHLAQALLCDIAPDEAADISAVLPCGQCHSCRLVQAGTHSDLHLINSDTRSIGVDSIRQLSQTLSESPRLGRAKVAIIYEAEKMTEAAANALLKTLEEPAGQATLILVSAHPERLLPTIRSRCQQWLVPLPKPDLVLAWFSEQGLAQQDVGAHSEQSWLGALNVNQGSPLATLAYLQAGLDQGRHALLSQFSQLADQPQTVMAVHTALLANKVHLTWLQLLLQDALQLALGLTPAALRLADNLDLARRVSQVGMMRLERALTGLLQLQQVGQTSLGRPVNAGMQLSLWLNDWLANAK